MQCTVILRYAGGGDWGTRAGKLGADVAVNPLTYLFAIVVAIGLVKWLGDSDELVFFLAALPVCGLTALARSPVGEAVQEQLEDQLPGAPHLTSPRKGVR